MALAHPRLSLLGAPLAGCEAQLTCPYCHGVLIHQHRRSVHTSASSFGQLVHDLSMGQMSAFDIDLGIWRASQRLLEFFEEKRPGQESSRGQTSALSMVSEVIAHYRDCPRARVRLHPQSGLYRLDVDLRRPINRLDDLNIPVAVTDVRDPRRGGQFASLHDTLLWLQAPHPNRRDAEAIELAGLIMDALAEHHGASTGQVHA